MIFRKNSDIPLSAPRRLLAEPFYTRHLVLAHRLQPYGTPVSKHASQRPHHPVKARDRPTAHESVPRSRVPPLQRALGIFDRSVFRLTRCRPRLQYRRALSPSRAHLVSDRALALELQKAPGSTGGGRWGGGGGGAPAGGSLGNAVAPDARGPAHAPYTTTGLVRSDGHSFVAQRHPSPMLQPYEGSPEGDICVTWAVDHECLSPETNAMLTALCERRRSRDPSIPASLSSASRGGALWGKSPKLQRAEPLNAGPFEWGALREEGPPWRCLSRVLSPPQWCKIRRRRQSFPSTRQDGPFPHSFNRLITHYSQPPKPQGSDWGTRLYSPIQSRADRELSGACWWRGPSTALPSGEKVHGFQCCRDR
ncbi:hypothetical protein Purlil1_7721 [Purpureocillium lilacinum]|uniref:Uncharacterized protein n=1 Tax=Purpureocillium lilacinum TaxID=33203 RepID=A0ABR0BX11_PURLI|nr:hypothetical protein Purlil1_7721 [Purpureocillium lilacinum]